MRTPTHCNIHRPGRTHQGRPGRKCPTSWGLANELAKGGIQSGRHHPQRDKHAVTGAMLESEAPVHEYKEIPAPKFLTGVFTKPGGIRGAYRVYDDATKEKFAAFRAAPRPTVKDMYDTTVGCTEVKTRWA